MHARWLSLRLISLCLELEQVSWKNMIFGRLLVPSFESQARSHIDSIARRINSRSSISNRGLNVSVSREARVGRSGDSARKRRVLHSSQPVAQVIPSKFVAKRGERDGSARTRNHNQTVTRLFAYRLSFSSRSTVAIRPSILS